MQASDEETLKTAKFDYLKLQTCLQDLKTSLPDLQPEAFTGAMLEFVKIFNVIGSAIAFAFKDITSKVAIIKRNYTIFPEVKGGLISFVEHEEKLKLQRLNGENPKEAPDAKYKNYESTSRTLLRLMWFFDFITNIFDNLERNRTMKVSDCCKKAYDESLGPHHPLAVRMAAKTAMSFTPSREKFLKELFPENLTEDEKYQAFKQCIETMTPVREFLWNYYGEHKLKDLP